MNNTTNPRPTNNERRPKTPTHFQPCHTRRAEPGFTDLITEYLTAIQGIDQSLTSYTEYQARYSNAFDGDEASRVTNLVEQLQYSREAFIEQIIKLTLDHPVVKRAGVGMEAA